MSAEFSGLPMDQLIGAPLKAACDAQTLLARATAEFIRTVGMEPAGDGKDPNKLKARTVDFTFDRPRSNPNPALPAGGGAAQDNAIETMKLSVPLLAILNTPSLSVKEVDVEFTMEVKSATSSKDTKESAGDFTAKGSGGFGPFSVSVEVHGSVSSKSENTRTSDNSAKYDVKVVARDDGMPEGLRRVLDMLNNSLAPVPALAAK
jgi:hypothetical protein